MDWRDFSDRAKRCKTSEEADALRAEGRAAGWRAGGCPRYVWYLLVRLWGDRLMARAGTVTARWEPRGDAGAMLIVSQANERPDIWQGPARHLEWWREALASAGVELTVRA